MRSEIKNKGRNFRLKQEILYLSILDQLIV